MSRWGNILLTALFLAGTGAPLTGMLLSPRLETSTAERRVLAKPPGLPASLKDLPAYPKRFEEFFDDNFGFRGDLIVLYNRLKAGMLNTSPTNKVVFGKSGWLYLASDGALADYLNSSPLSASDLNSWRGALQQRRDWLAARGAEYYFFVAPNKHAIYPEYYPDYFRKVGGTSRREQLFRCLSECANLPAKDLTPVLRNAKAQSRVYRVTDSHWNALGAYSAFRAMIEFIAGKTSLPGLANPQGYEFAPVAGKGGDLAVMAGIGDAVAESLPTVVGGLGDCLPKPAAADATGTGPPLKAVVYRCGGNPTRALFLADSFGDTLAPFLAREFGELVQVHYSALGRDNLALLKRLLGQRGYDIVIEQRVERTLGRVPRLERMSETACCRRSATPQAATSSR